MTTAQVEVLLSSGVAISANISMTPATAVTDRLTVGHMVGIVSRSHGHMVSQSTYIAKFYANIEVYTSTTIYTSYILMVTLSVTTPDCSPGAFIRQLYMSRM